MEARTFNCPKCAGRIVVRAPERSEVVGCENCGALLDVTNPDAKLIAEYEYRTRRKPLIPLGTRGTLRGEAVEVIGFLTRQITVEGIGYTWDEYLLWNPYLGYRWLTEYTGHWTYAKPCLNKPVLKKTLTGHAAAETLGLTFVLFQTGNAEVIYVLGEFYWRVQKGDRAKLSDYVCPPNILSFEKTADEESWSAGDYLSGRQVWDAFKLPNNPPAAMGVFSCQPSPYRKLRRPMTALAATFAAALVVVQAAAYTLCENRLVHEEPLSFSAADQEKSRVSKTFGLDGRTSNVEVEFRTNLSNNWAYFNGALINEETSEAVNFSSEVEYHSGPDWTEGDRNESQLVSRVPSGKYFLRVEPETPAAELHYTVRVTRDVPCWTPFWIAMAAVVLPYLLFLFLERSFEFRRWKESDFPWFASE